MNFRGQKFASVKGVSDIIRWPIKEKIRLGFKAHKPGTDIYYPCELPFFLLPPQLYKYANASVERAQEMGVTRAAVLKFIAENKHRLAEKLPVIILKNEREAFFPQSYKWYGQTRGLKCHGNGEIAERYDENIGALIQVECPCENLKTAENLRGECSLIAHLFVIVGEDSGGVYQIDIGSYHSITNINSGLALTYAVFGRVAKIPMLLYRIKKETHALNQKQIHWPLKIEHTVPTSQIEAYRKDNEVIYLETQRYSLPAPDDTNPTADMSNVADVDDADGFIDEKLPDKKDFVTLINNCKSVEELLHVWNKIIAHASMFNNEERKTLNLLKEQKQRELQEPPPEVTKREPFGEQDKVSPPPVEEVFPESINIDQIIRDIKYAKTVEEADRIYNEYIEKVKGENRTRLIRARDKRVTELRKSEGKLV